MACVEISLVVAFTVCSGVLELLIEHFKIFLESFYVFVI